MIIDVGKLNRIVRKLILRTNDLHDRLKNVEQKLRDIEPRLNAKPQPRPQPETDVWRPPMFLVTYYGKRFLDTIGEEGIVTETCIDGVLDEAVLEAAKKVRQLRGLRDWKKEPETAEEAAVRCVKDIKLGYRESKSTTDGMFITVAPTHNGNHAHSWTPKPGQLERRSGKDRRSGSSKPSIGRRTGYQRRRNRNE